MPFMISYGHLGGSPTLPHKAAACYHTVCDDYGPQSFKTEDEAWAHVTHHLVDIPGTVASFFSYNLNIAVWIRAYDDPNWKTREERRMQNLYVKPEFPMLTEHYVHVALTDSSKISYTPDAEKGRKNIQVTTRPGRYLKKFFPEMSNDEIEAHAQAFTKFTAYELLWAETPDEIEHVYLNGPSSCMAHGSSHYSSHIHPTRIYGAGDLKLAYIKRDERITGRAVCLPRKMTYSTIYGDNGRLSTALTMAGYKPGSILGAKLLKIPSGEGYVMPFIDEGEGVKDCGDHFTIGGSDYDTGYTNGLTCEGSYCDRCEDHCTETNSIYHGDQTWCQYCTEEYSFYCEASGTNIPNDDGVDTVDHGMVALRVFENDGFTCALTDNPYMEGRIELVNGDEVHSSTVGRGVTHDPESNTYDYTPAERAAA